MKKKKRIAPAKIRTRFLRFKVQNYTIALSMLTHERGSKSVLAREAKSLKMKFIVRVCSLNIFIKQFDQNKEKQKSGRDLFLSPLRGH